ncbi:hypothetical protein LTR84_009867 [Exophiala bonariae]|uniref:Ferric oxidoreductase domain-containing protein n=1 Tax=Exophiala bonariae TaxID=1690606 RepID=A0AAV9NJF1_9EURO|nr:hypothetical protein LTR84_009867 [Exophiala bonariae]
MLPLLLRGSLLLTAASAAFVGLGTTAYKPYCCTACRASLAAATLACTPHHHGGAHSHGATTPPDCYASDEAFLTSLAYCLNVTCTDQEQLPIWELEKWWAQKVTENPTVPPTLLYTQALGLIGVPPQGEYSAGLTLNTTMRPNSAALAMYRNFYPIFEENSSLLNRYSLVVLVVGFATPVLVSWAGYAPFMADLYAKATPWLVYPSIFGRYHARPLPWLLGNAPTMGQFQYIAMFFVLNLVLSSVSYTSAQPHPWGYNKAQEINAYIGYRTGEFGYAILPLTILFSGRNNILLWLTNWSHGTFLILHRWVARLFILLAIVHSLTLLIAYKGSGIYAMNFPQAYFSWGIVGTVLAVVMLFSNSLWLRRWSYEVFLIQHILFVVILIVACWYHVILRFGKKGSHEYWLYAAIAVWVFDRLMRIVRIIKNRARYATVTDVGQGHVRVDIPGVRWGTAPGIHAYVHFPTITSLRPWENHPFSVNSTAHLSSWRKHDVPTSATVHETSSSENSEKHGGQQPSVTSAVDTPIQTTIGISLFIKKNTGMTKHLKNHSKLLTFLDGPYPKYSSKSLLDCDRVILIGGGIGITGLLAWLNVHPNVRLTWSMKETSSALVNELQSALHGVGQKDILINQRIDVESLLFAEVQAGYKSIGVVVCGPGGLCDDVRAVVARLGRHEKTIFELEVDTFSW